MSNCSANRLKWTMHGLVRYEEDMRLLYPGGTKDILNVLESSYDFNHVPPAKSKSMVKYYVKEKVSEGCCGYEYPSKGVRCRILYDEKILPYLGMWITAGGFRGDYNCAFEPSNGYYDSIEIAKENDSLYLLKPERSLEFDIVLELEGS